MRRGRVVTLIAVCAALAAFAVTGCDVKLLYGPWPGPAGDGQDGGEPSDIVEESSLLRIVAPEGGEVYHPGEVVGIEWAGTLEADSVAIELYRYGQPIVTIAAQTPHTGSFDWVIPADFDTLSEAPDDYRISVTAQDARHTPGELIVQALSEPFTIVAAESGGLSDVTVGLPEITITVTDNGQQIDGDTIDIVLNGELVVAGQVLAGPPGSEIVLSLLSGANLLEIVAINEGTVSPNTAELAISDVVEGESVQQWRLLAGERGSLTITAP